MAGVQYAELECAGRARALSLSMAPRRVRDGTLIMAACTVICVMRRVPSCYTCPVSFYTCNHGNFNFVMRRGWLDVGGSSTDARKRGEPRERDNRRCTLASGVCDVCDKRGSCRIIPRSFRDWFDLSESRSQRNCLCAVSVTPQTIVTC